MFEYEWSVKLGFKHYFICRYSELLCGYHKPLSFAEINFRHAWLTGYYDYLLEYEAEEQEQFFLQFNSSDIDDTESVEYAISTVHKKASKKYSLSLRRLLKTITSLVFRSLLRKV